MISAYTIVIRFVVSRLSSHFFIAIPSLPSFAILVTILLVSIMRTLSDAILKRSLTKDLQLEEVAKVGKYLFPIDQVLRDLARAVQRPLSIHSGTERRTENAEDVLYVIEPVIRNVHFM